MIHEKTLCVINAEPNQTVIRATHRTSDLIPAFLEVIKDTPEYTQIMSLPVSFVPSSAFEDDNCEWWDSEDAMYKLEELFEVLDSYSPDGFYFGAHPGDGSDFGYWECELSTTDKDRILNEKFPKEYKKYFRSMSYQIMAVEIDALYNVLVLKKPSQYELTRRYENLVKDILSR